jgi:hypothetical protein
VLKLKNWRIGRPIRIIEVITLTHIVVLQPEAAVENFIYPYILRPIATASAIIERTIK